MVKKSILTVLMTGLIISSIPAQAGWLTNFWAKQPDAQVHTATFKGMSGIGTLWALGARYIEHTKIQTYLRNPRLQARPNIRKTTLASGFGISTALFGMYNVQAIKKANPLNVNPMVQQKRQLKRTPWYERGLSWHNTNLWY